MGHRDTPEAALLAEAISLAAMAHGGQTDKAGEPYILHPLRVMLACKGLEARVAGVLHDTVEDTDLELSDLARFGDKVVEAVDALTRREGEDYFAFIGRARANPIARQVKIADLRDNYLNPDRQETLPPSLRERYAKAWAMLVPGIAARQRFRARVSIRRAWPVKPEAEALDGREVIVEGGWPIGEGRGSGIYRGEWAMILPLGAPVAWIASGDLDFLGPA